MNRRKTTEQVIQNLIERVRALEAEAHSHPHLAQINAEVAQRLERLEATKHNHDTTPDPEVSP